MHAIIEPLETPLPTLVPTESVAVVTVECACGCTRTIDIAANLLEDPRVNRVKKCYQPRGYHEDYGDFVVSGSTRYVYALLRCLNSYNED
jgi:hypothetical protein